MCLLSLFLSKGNKCWLTKFSGKQESLTDYAEGKMGIHLLAICTVTGEVGEVGELSAFSLTGGLHCDSHHKKEEKEQAVRGRISLTSDRDMDEDTHKLVQRNVVAVQ